MLSDPPAVLDRDRLHGKDRRAPRTRVEEGGGYLPILRRDHFSTVTERTPALYPPSLHWCPILDDGEHPRGPRR